MGTLLLEVYLYYVAMGIITLLLASTLFLVIRRVTLGVVDLIHNRGIVRLREKQYLIRQRKR